MKKLIINTAACDARNVTAQQLSPYDAIEINSALVLTSPEAQNILSEYPVSMNTSNVVSLCGDAALSVSNGPYTIAPGTAAGGKKALLVNGPLEILPGAEDVLQDYVQITVNGPLTCPANLGSRLQNVLVNGPRILYPDGAVLLKFPVLTRQFILRAKAETYYAPTLAAVDTGLDLTLLPGGTRLISEKVVVAESLLEALLPLISETAEIVTVPDGTVYVERQLLLETYTPKQYGGKIYVDGDLFCQSAHIESLDWVEYLAVSGNAMLSEDMVEPFMEKAAVSGQIRIMPAQKGLQISDKPVVTVDASLLELAPDGLRISDCALVELAEDISPKMILEKIKIQDCSRIHCTQAQKSAVSTVAEGCGYLGPADREGEAGAVQETVINTAQYTF